MNVIQVIAYFRLFTDWPANTMMIKEAIYNAITLQLFSEEALELIGIQSESNDDTPRKE